MTCGDIELRIPDFIAGHLEDEEAGRIDEHLAVCEACRSYCQQVKGLYTLDLETPALDSASGPRQPLQMAPVPPVVPGVGAAATKMTRARWLPRAVRRAALVLIVVSLALLAWERYGTGPAWQPLPLEAFAVDLETLPEPAARGTWLREFDIAERLSQLTGLPIIEEFGMSMCPLCRHLEKELDQPRSQELLAGFVRFRGSLDGILNNDRSGIPDWVFQERDGQRLLYQPVMRIAWDEDHVTEPIYSVLEHDDVRALVDRWQEIAERLDVEPLGARRFSELRVRIMALPHLLEQRRLAEALDLLEGIVELDGQRRTTLVDVARDLLVQIDAQIDRQITEIERLYGSTRVERRQAIDLAERLGEQLGPHAEKRLQQYR